MPPQGSWRCRAFAVTCPVPTSVLLPLLQALQLETSGVDHLEAMLLLSILEQATGSAPRIVLRNRPAISGVDNWSRV